MTEEIDCKSRSHSLQPLETVPLKLFADFLEGTMNDDDVFEAIFSSDRVLASAARALYEKRRANEPAEFTKEPQHCEACFEGCEKSQPPTKPR